MEPERVSVLLRDLLVATKDGDWGQEVPANGYVAYRVIRGTDFPAVRIGDISSVPVRYLNAATAHRRKLEPDDILLETAGGSPGRPTGRSLLVTDRLISLFGLPATCASFARFLRVDRTKADPRFVYWYLQYLYATGEMEEHQVQHTGIARFQYTKFAERQPIPLPTSFEQHAIAHILGTLDDKIELNRRMNETLDAIAQALFKSWFVDFDPVRAKAEGVGTSVAEPIADIFPTSFEDSEIGQIPQGWRVELVGSVIELAYGKALKEENRKPGPIPVFGSNGQVGWHDEKLADGPGIIVGRKGNPGVVTWAPSDFFAIDTTFYVVPKDLCHSLYFLYYALRGHDLASLGADSAVPGLNRNLVYMSRQLVPSDSVLDVFDSQVRAIFERRYQAIEESRILASLRDTLLPKLISGELRVKDAERIVERVA